MIQYPEALHVQKSGGFQTNGALSREGIKECLILYFYCVLIIRELFLRELLVVSVVQELPAPTPLSLG